MKRWPARATIESWLSYDPDTGVFIWSRESRPARPLLGRRAGSLNTAGYVLIGIRGYRQMFAHHLAWIVMHGPIPDGLEIDHRDGNPSNNAISNLRLATSVEQKRNKRVQSNNKCGLKGAYFHACRKARKWRSQIRVGRRLIFLGYFLTPEEAHAAYQRAAVIHFGEFARIT